MIKTDTKCDMCAHHKVCKIFNKPNEMVKNFESINDDPISVDMNIIISCVHYRNVVPLNGFGVR